MSCVAGVPHLVLSAGGRDCLRAGDTCTSDVACSPRLRTLRQCVAGDGSMKLGPGARNHCENAMTALLSTPLHGCQCKRGMKREKNCLSIYWSLHQSVLHGETDISSLTIVCGVGKSIMQGNACWNKIGPHLHSLDSTMKWKGWLFCQK